ncbi:hypothetical protein ABT336_11790 [Micromonospora sp. NPDC000207]|uniref:hypothetical protein n=1 Tax=Micromonospora sp. NPDC000207 TaxID=3154246 RepID=UPI003331B345
MNWPPVYVDLLGERHDWDAVAESDPETEYDDGSEPITYRELAFDICDRWGGIEEFLNDQWSRQVS